MRPRRKSRKVKIGKLFIGGDAPISIQSMTTTETTDAQATIEQINGLEEIGCDIVRVSANTMDAAKALKEIKANIGIPLVADIHFDYRIALEAAKYADKLRINPGNIGGQQQVKAVVQAAKEYSLPMRIGVNLGSLERDLFMKYGYSPQAMVESAFRHIKMLEAEDFLDIIVSLKASDVPRMVEAYRLFAAQSEYPIHLGVTEAGSKVPGAIKSSMGMGMLLSEGIGDTIRVSLSDDPREEAKVGKLILRSLGLRKQGVEVTSCPTCARTEVDVIKLVEELENRTEGVREPIHVAIMGCAVNGPGESGKADIGIVGAPGNHLLYKNGKITRRIEDKDVMPTLLKEIDELAAQRR
ncbi:TPA: flavodoxin-dependent (E)-4-hydroxy-3-methylbut-2-enyl-diphosphate synthase [Candidatus Woesearchaeota archaeon]|nr:flavodoxin-dependent (E)-4-hydroxy-3-methylbut-2-enyl-diphosphate synthase [Candidatus Woesearchaeota archaeon]HIH91942.1 flavodoxin-dependent (E)-4-hydroxy-3-methylbut-2-enyl-diphosphate synthase [Candidatus Woesearchaeota archaeon]HII63961.1 flavodoxin-dependent (E)-4-hydroxy-3-methylbut-2-enyl-diphosphate synthase [Candidatus Woesearchaeota archaeon]HIJ18561.1 flavodoxin-dependent (E)-4-hydroxy-3-methylbut-2-enyl-diphosphate synthase [Candidatus Woesearchaeota archaeon]